MLKSTLKSAQVLALVRRIPKGRVTTYASIAKALKTSPRAVARVLAANKQLIATPCHRVVASNGSLAGYRLGLRLKAALLKSEGIAVKNDAVAELKQCLWQPGQRVKKT